MKNRDNIRSYAIILSVIAFIISILIYLGNSNPTYRNIWILPAVTGLIFFFAGLTIANIKANLPLVLAGALFYLRNVIAIFFFYLSDYASFFKNVTYDGITNAVQLMSLETALLLFYCIKKSKQVKIEIPIKYYSYGLKYKSDATYILIGIVLLLVFFNPQFLDDYISIFSAENIRTFQTDDSYRGPVYSVFAVLMPIAYLSLALLLLSKIRQRNRPYLMVLAITCIPFLFMNGSDAFNIICFLALCLTALKFRLFSRSRFNIYVGAGVSLAIIYIGLTIANGAFGAESKDGWEKISEMLQAYQPGVSNLAGVFQMKDYDKLMTLFYDLYSTIPFRGSIFGVENEVKLVYLFTEDNNANSQIIPCIGQLYYYLGFTSVLVELLYVYFAYKAYYRSLCCCEPYTYFTLILLVLYLILTPTTYNTTIFLSRYFSMILPMYLLYNYLNKKDKII